MEQNGREEEDYLNTTPRKAFNSARQLYCLAKLELSAFLYILFKKKTLLVYVFLFLLLLLLLSVFAQLPSPSCSPGLAEAKTNLASVTCIPIWTFPLEHIPSKSPPLKGAPKWWLSHETVNSATWWMVTLPLSICFFRCHLDIRSGAVVGSQQHQTSTSLSRSFSPSALMYACIHLSVECHLWAA